MRITLGNAEAFHAIQPLTWQVGPYKGYLICGSQIGYFIVQPDNLVATFAGYILYTASPQEAGNIVDGLLATQKKTRSAAPATKKKAKPAASSAKKKITPAVRHRSSSRSYTDHSF